MSIVLQLYRWLCVKIVLCVQQFIWCYFAATDVLNTNDACGARVHIPRACRALLQLVLAPPPGPNNSTRPHPTATPDIPVSHLQVPHRHGAKAEQKSAAAVATEEAAGTGKPSIRVGRSNMHGTST